MKAGLRGAPGGVAFDAVITRIRPLHAAGWGVAALVAVSAVLAFQQARTSTPVSVSEALGTFRHDGDASAAVPRFGPAPGVYTYRASGSEAGTVGPLRIRRPVPADARLVATPAPGGFQTELQVSKEHIEGYRFRVQGDWAVLAWRRVDVTFLGVGRDDRNPVRGSARWIPLRPRVGMTWTLDFWTRSLHATGTGRVTGRRTVTVDGARRTVYLIDLRTTTAGAHGGPRRETLWWSPEDRLPLRWVSTTRLDGVVGFRSHMDMTAASLRPAR